MTDQTIKTPEHEAIYLRVRDMVLFGEVEPGQPVTIQGLTARIGAGMTPVREAIRRLTAEAALEMAGNRRVRVPEMTRDRLDQLTLARRAIEPKLALLAAKRVGADVLTELERIDKNLNAAIASGNIRGYLEHNYKFHFCLYAAADAVVLERIARSLWLQAGPSLRVMCGRFGTGSLPDKHAETIAALRAGRAGDIGALIEEDICQGLDQVRAVLADAAPEARN